MILSPEFIKSYGRISNLSEESVKTLEEIQEKELTEHSRLKTCWALWQEKEARIAELEAQSKEDKEFYDQFRLNDRTMRRLRSNLNLKGNTFTDCADELQARIAELEAELNQQQFNNKHNLSIDQKVSDRIAELEEENNRIRNVNVIEFSLRTKEYDKRVAAEARVADYQKMINNLNGIHGERIDELQARTKRLASCVNDLRDELYHLRYHGIVDEVLDKHAETIKLAKEISEGK